MQSWRKSYVQNIGSDIKWEVNTQKYFLLRRLVCSSIKIHLIVHGMNLRTKHYTIANLKDHI